MLVFSGISVFPKLTLFRLRRVGVYPNLPPVKEVDFNHLRDEVGCSSFFICAVRFIQNTGGQTHMCEIKWGKISKK